MSNEKKNRNITVTVIVLVLIVAVSAVLILISLSMQKKITQKHTDTDHRPDCDKCYQKDELYQSFSYFC